MNRNINPRCSIDGLHREGYPEFFTSLTDPALDYQGILLSRPCSLVGRVPAIGHYQNVDTKRKGKTVGEFYNWRVRIALIELSRDQLGNLIPPSVRAALAKGGIRDLSNVEGYINILGGFVFPGEQPKEAGKENSCNIAFHPVVCRWRGNLEHYNFPIQAGIFDGNGVIEMPGGIAFNKLTNLALNYHGALSPDNGRVRFDASRGLITFWTVGIYNGRANVTFNVIANNDRVERQLLEITRQRDCQGVCEVIGRVRASAGGADVSALSEVQRILERVCPARASGALAIPLPVVEAGGGSSYRDSLEDDTLAAVIASLRTGEEAKARRAMIESSEDKGMQLAVARSREETGQDDIERAIAESLLIDEEAEARRRSRVSSEDEEMQLALALSQSEIEAGRSDYEVARDIISFAELELNHGNWTEAERLLNQLRPVPYVLQGEVDNLRAIIGMMR